MLAAAGPPLRLQGNAESRLASSQSANLGRHSMSYCDVVEVRTLEDALGATCARPANELCSDCGVSVCSAHAERCDLCGQSFCPSCFFFHQAKHSMPAFTERSEPEKRNRA